MDLTAEKFPHFDEAGKALVRKAYEIAAEVLKDDTRDNGAPFIEHPLGVALIASDEIGLPAVCVAAVFLHEATRKHPETDISQAGFPEEVLKIVEGLNKISTIKPKDTRLEAENYKKLIVQYSTDPRVTVLKIADRLEVMRNLGMFPKLSRERKILETLMLYIPLAHQLGLYNIKSEMEDTYFRFAEPEQYRAITNKLKATEKDREKLTAEFIEPLKKRLSDAGIVYKLKIRTKTAYSIFKKMQKQKVPFEGVFDVFAIRFIIDCDTDHATELKLCWDVYSYVTEEYESDTSRLRDWLTQPKPNGYECLHITVKNKEGAYVEVQIRTKRMDDLAENGDAAHWSYKGIQHVAALDKWLTSVRYNLEHPQEATSEDLPQPPSKEIFVFTPSGELRILPAGASVLDFAFNIHSNIGIRCTGGKINGKAVSIKEKLKTGDVVEIMTGKNQKPSADWVNFVVSSKARGKIRQVLHEAEFQKASEGKELLERRLKNWKLELPDDMLREFMKKFHYPTLKELYSAIGDGTLDINDIKTFILDADKEAVEEEEQTKAAAKTPWSNANEGNGDDLMIINAKGVKGIDYKMAKCCNPVFGDDVFGFVTRDSGIKIHRISCPNAARLIEMYPYRIQRVKWADSPSSGSFQATVRVISYMESYVVNEIMDIINNFKSSLRSFNVIENQKSGNYDITMKISVPSNTELDKVISQIRNLKSVQKVSRQ
ncbi:MAG: bifunctional (p)ppGpp synthetase/guanosine-3',5'-bis(diphosphate) 3'-pyrophosphohydrolase [Bacteroidales bacterium]|nr:bifunctional (p)ppGpp synthetase/guanosine-3',5'-bis(diphosphate) 3'-pyrophosphohydrolase [Bacteroidales bacterium]MEE3406837.1 RelA/SpoT family protein [Candidatus Cryptobacteroides sp.]MBO7365341.1 bifunctional (p)ppGpp synthetase/guanosine-3',5'-bis(diphosphate) 3'-pyrophosphohydrolase [Bacteroidales bacterium]MBQ2110044.1 bifunctional (p)ppGpp synthetase/guanosine-3',5'-bis(diphosphate) 3'-pyrophosphohydrolase [Bacteroidales bacterium]MBQ3917343.1 bifunctional (p)ppGpp synthetase/guanosi